MRVVAGTLRGRTIGTPRGSATRPTSDRVRESLFNMLASRSLLEGAKVVDLFAGSGALGIEAISRGAAHAAFVETDRYALSAIEANLQSLQIEHQTSVRRGDALRIAATLPACDLCFADPPYAFDDWETLLESVRATHLVIESNREIAVPQPWIVVMTRRYGGTVVQLLERARRCDEPIIPKGDVQ